MIEIHDGDLRSWERALQAENKSKNTVRAYLYGITRFIAWCDREGERPIASRALIQRWMADIMDEGAEPATARTYQHAVRMFTKWLLEVGDIESDPLVGLKLPKLNTKVVDALTDDQVQAMIRACKGTSLIDHRDEAIVRFMVETGVRSTETLSLMVQDVNLDAGTAIIHRGKGGKGRVVPFGPKTATSIDKYLRSRRRNMVTNDRLFVSAKPIGEALGYPGLRLTLANRAEAAGIEKFRPHRLRNTAATRWLRQGGSEAGLMAVAGWSDRSMLDRYTQSSAAERAIEEARRLQLGF